MSFFVWKFFENYRLRNRPVLISRLLISSVCSIYWSTASVASKTRQKSLQHTWTSWWISVKHNFFLYIYTDTAETGCFRKVMMSFPKTSKALLNEYLIFLTAIFNALFLYCLHDANKVPSWMYSHLSPSVPGIDFASISNLTRIKWLLKTKEWLNEWVMHITSIKMCRMLCLHKTMMYFIYFMMIFIYVFIIFSSCPCGYSTTWQFVRKELKISIQKAARITKHSLKWENPQSHSASSIFLMNFDRFCSLQGLII